MAINTDNSMHKHQYISIIYTYFIHFIVVPVPIFSRFFLTLQKRQFFSHCGIIDFSCTSMAYIKCRWYEPAYQSEDRGIIPAVWLEEHGGHQIVRWPPWSQYQQPYETAQLPEADWKIFF